MVNKNNLDKASNLLDYFKKTAKEKKDIAITFNRNKVKYTMAEILQDFTVEEIKLMIDYYCSSYTELNLTEFCYEYDSINNEMISDAEDELKRRALAEQTRQRVVEFRNKYGDHK